MSPNVLRNVCCDPPGRVPRGSHAVAVFLQIEPHTQGRPPAVVLLLTDPLGSSLKGGVGLVGDVDCLEDDGPFLRDLDPEHEVELGVIVDPDVLSRLIAHLEKLLAVVVIRQARGDAVLLVHQGEVADVLGLAGKGCRLAVRIIGVRIDIGVVGIETESAKPARCELAPFVITVLE